MRDNLWYLLANPTIKKLAFSISAVIVIIFIGYLAQYTIGRYVDDGGILEEINRYPDRITIASTTIALVEIPPVSIKYDK